MACEYDLRPLWKAILDVYSEISKICDRHGLRYFVAYGTEIGAMRHHGFIPWDDDFDMYMPRPDYNRLIEIAQKELPRHLKWRSIETEPAYHLLFGKVAETRADVLESIETASNLILEDGVFVDIFPLDGLPSTWIGVYWWNMKRSLMRRALIARTKGWSVKNIPYKLISQLMPRFENKHEELTYIQRWISQLVYDECKNVGWVLSTFRFPRFVKQRTWFDSVKMVPFADIQVPVPIGVEEDLHAMYGDYKRMPPVEQRVPSHQKIKDRKSCG